jgi:hypothetical protein
MRLEIGSRDLDLKLLRVLGSHGNERNSTEGMDLITGAMERKEC